MSDVRRPEGLECDHCGGTAIDFKPPSHPGGSWHLFDGDGGACDECGWPGSVSVDDGDSDEALAAYWSTNDWDDGLMCRLPDCLECRDDKAQIARSAR